MSTGDGCCCGNICCNCTPGESGECADSGSVPNSLHIAVTTGCGTYGGTLTRNPGVNCWQGTVMLNCITQDVGNVSGGVHCMGPFLSCWLLCCGSNFPTVGGIWELFSTCDPGCSNLGTPTSLISGTPSSTSCSPFLATFYGLDSISACIKCTNDTFNVTISE